MKVRILSGNQAGQVVDLPGTEAENALATGFAELVKEPSPKASKPAKDEPEEETPSRAVKRR